MPHSETSLTKYGLPWVEKYRPNTLDELISHGEIVSTLRRLLDAGQLPHLLFYGPPGGGKTTTILAIAKELFKPSEMGSMVLELNASDERGIDVVRGEILSFSGTRTMFGDRRRKKLVILDEADAMTKDAQNALRRVIEKYTDNVRFCLIGNFLSKLIPAIQSRCTRFRFGPVDGALMRERLRLISDRENVRLEKDGLDAIVLLSDGDMRRAINVLQTTHMATKLVNEENVYNCVGQPLPKEMTICLTWLLNEPLNSSVKKLMQLQTEKGVSLQDVITHLHRLVQRLSDVPLNARIFLIERLAEIERRLVAGCNEQLQRAALASAFSIAKEYVVGADGDGAGLLKADDLDTAAVLSDIPTADVGDLLK